MCARAGDPVPDGFAALLLPNGNRSGLGTPARRIIADFPLSAYGFCCLCGIGFINFFICTGGRDPPLAADDDFVGSMALLLLEEDGINSLWLGAELIASPRSW